MKDGPKRKLGRDLPKNEIGPEPAQKSTYLWLDSTKRVGWADVPAKKPIAGYCAEHSN